MHNVLLHCVSIPIRVLSRSRQNAIDPVHPSKEVSIPIRVLSRSRRRPLGFSHLAPFVSIPIRVLSRSRLGAEHFAGQGRSGFNPYKGFKPIATRHLSGDGQYKRCFNPYKGFKPIATQACLECAARLYRFNPYKGFKPIATAGAWNAVYMQFSRFDCADQPDCSILDC